MRRDIACRAGVLVGNGKPRLSRFPNQDGGRDSSARSLIRLLCRLGGTVRNSRGERVGKESSPGAVVLFEVGRAQPHALFAREHSQGVGIYCACALVRLVRDAL